MTGNTTLLRTLSCLRLWIVTSPSSVRDLSGMGILLTYREVSKCTAVQSTAVQSTAVQSNAVQSTVVQSIAVQSIAVQSLAVQSLKVTFLAFIFSKHINCHVNIYIVFLLNKFVLKWRRIQLKKSMKSMNLRKGLWNLWKFLSSGPWMRPCVKSQAAISEKRYFNTFVLKIWCFYRSNVVM